MKVMKKGEIVLFSIERCYNKIYGNDNKKNR